MPADGHIICHEDMLGQWTPLRWSPRVNPDGWDEATLELIGIFPEEEDDSIHTTVPDANTTRGWTGYKPFTSLAMWGQQAAFERRGQNVWVAQVQCRGMLNPTRPKLRHIQAQGEIMQVEDALLPGQPAAIPRVQCIQRTITVELSYLATTQPNTALVGTKLAPENAPPAPDNLFTSLPADKSVYHYPNGWILMARPYETLPGVPNAYLVRDVFVWEHDISPG